MDLHLYDYLQEKFARYAGELDPREESVQELIEAYNPEVLESGLARRINQYLEKYNRYRVHAGLEAVKLRYYQILALYYTELYFQARLQKDSQLQQFSQKLLAYWMATGSGKTIVMHLNILQYLS